MAYRGYEAAPFMYVVRPVSIFACFAGGIAGAGTWYHDMTGIMQSGGEFNMVAPSPTGGIFKNLIFSSQTWIAAGESLTITLRVNSAPTALTVTLSGGENLGVDTVNEVRVSRGDFVDWQIVKVGAGALGRISWGAEFYPT